MEKEQLEKILAISRDFYRFSKNNLRIKTKDARIAEFVPNMPQRALIDYVLKCLSEGVPIRVIILKARQMGLSTAVEALIYWWTSTHKNITAAIIGHEESSSRNLYTMFRRYYDYSNPIFKPTVRYNTRNDLTFESYDDAGNQIGLGSVIKTATAKNTSAGRSDTVQLLHGSEIGEWENGQELVASMMQTVPYLPNTMVFLESTAKGRGNYFHTEWVNAVSGEGSFTPFFFPWWLMDEYEVHNDEPLGQLTEYEEFLMELFDRGYTTLLGEHITVENKEAKIKFYRTKSKEFATTPERMYQEYPSTEHEAFIASGSNVFNVLALENLEKNTIDESEVEHFEVRPGEKYNDYSMEYIPYDAKIKENNGRLKVWEHPALGEEYVIGADVAEGLATGDYSVAEVVNTRTMQTVARWRGKIDPDKFGEVLGAIGEHYNSALIGVEVNNHGLSTVQKLRDIFYTNLYKRINGYDEDFEEPTSHLGWKTDMRTKRVALDSLAMLIREGINLDKDKVFIEEAFSFVRDERGRMAAEIGAHDDTVMAKAITFQLFPWGDNDISGLKVHIPETSMSRKSKHKVVK